MNNSFFKKLLALVKKHKIITAIVGCVLIYLAYRTFLGTPATTTTLQYVKVKKGDLLTTVTGTGQVTPSSQVDLKPKVNANVTAVLVASGDKVQAGQVLFKLDARDAYKQVRDAQLSLDQAQLAFDKLKQPAQTIDVLSVQNAIKKAQTAKTTQDTLVQTAYNNLLNAGLEAVPEGTFTTETAPTLSGSYLKGVEGQIKIGVYGGGNGTNFSVSGVALGSGQANSIVPQAIADTGLFIKFNTLPSQTNWVIDIPNKRASNYLSLLTSYQNAIQNRDNNNADSDRTIAESTQKLADLQRGAIAIDVQAQELSVQQRKNALIDAQNNLSDYTITAPFSGTMASVSGQVGLSAVVASSQSGTSLGTIITDQKLAQITLNEADIAKVKVGQKVNLTFDAVDGLTATGTVAEIDGLGTVTQGVVTYKVKIIFSSDDARIKPSMSVSTDIITDSKTNVLLVPNQALKQDASGYYVETDSLATSTRPMFDKLNATSMNATGTRNFSATSTLRTGTSSANRQKRATSTTVTSTVTLIRIPVTIGAQNDTQTEITSGLTEYQQIVIKKTAGTATAKVPSVTSLFTPQRGGGGGVPRGN